MRVAREPTGAWQAVLSVTSVTPLPYRYPDGRIFIRGHYIL